MFTVTNQPQDLSLSYWRSPNPTNLSELNTQDDVPSDAMFRVLADNLPTLCWLANGNGYIGWYNRRWYEYTGTTPQEMEGWGWTKVHHPATLSDVLERWRTSIGSGAPFEMTFPLRGADGIFRPFLTRIYPVHDTNGQVKLWCGVNTEISQQVAAEDQLKRVNERMQMALDAGAIVGTWVWHVKENLVTADPLFARTFDLDPDLCVAGFSLETAVSSIHVEDRARVEAAIGDALLRGGEYRCEYRVRCSDQRYRWVEACGRVEMDDTGKPERFPGILIDVSERVEARFALDESNALLRTFINAVPGVVYAKDRDGRLLLANNGTAKLLGRSVEDIVGRTDEDLLDDPRQAAVIMENDRRIMTSGEPETVEEVVTQADGNFAVWLSTKEPLRNAHGEVTGIVGTSIDITARNAARDHLKQMNDELVRRVAEEVDAKEAAFARVHEAQKLETLGQLTGGVAHDFNNLLSPIVAAFDIVGRLHPGDARTQRTVTMGLQAAESARVMIRRLLAFARRQQLEVRPADLCELVRGVQDMLRRLLGPQIVLEVDVPDRPMPCLVDSNQLELAILNLAVNSRDAMPEGGTLTIAVSGEAPPESTDPCVCLSVTDTGTGMEEAILKRAIEPFFTTKETGRGTGLGLSSIHGMAVQSGGRFELMSSPGEGTTAKIYLPVATDYEKPAAKRTASPPPPKRSGTILLVDDEELVRTSTASMLNDGGYDVVHASSAAHALRLLNENTDVDALVTDFAMPGMSGLQLVQKVRSVRPHMPSLIITGYANVPLVSDDVVCLGKPFREEELLTVIASLVGAHDPD